MPEYLAPGVFVEEIDSGSKPIEGVGVNTVAFIGYAKSGDYNKPTFITNWTQFCQQFGEEENALTTALCAELGMTVSDVRAAKKASRKGWAAYATETVDRAARAGKTPVKNFSDFLRKHNIPSSSQPFLEGGYLAHSVYGYYQNGGGRCYVIRVARPDDIKALSYSPDGVKSMTAAAPAQLTAGPLLLTAKEAGAAGNDIKIEVEHVGDEGFTLKISQGTGASESLGAKDKPLTADGAAGARSRLVTLEKIAAATVVRPDAKTFVLAGGADSLPAKTGNAALAPPGRRSPTGWRTCAPMTSSAMTRSGRGWAVSPRWKACR